MQQQILSAQPLRAMNVRLGGTSLAARGVSQRLVRPISKQSQHIIYWANLLTSLFHTPQIRRSNNTRVVKIEALAAGDKVRHPSHHKQQSHAINAVQLCIPLPPPKKTLHLFFILVIVTSVEFSHHFPLPDAAPCRLEVQLLRC